MPVSLGDHAGVQAVIHPSPIGALNSPRLRKATRLVAAFFLLLAIVVDIAYLYSGWDRLYDFGSFVAAGRNLAEGINPYGPRSDLVFHIEFSQVKVGGAMPNLNPPVSLLAFRLLAGSDPRLALGLWRLISAILFILALFLLARLFPFSVIPNRILWAFALAGLWQTLRLGQIYTLLLLLSVLVWYASARGRPVLAGVCLGLLVAIKPNFALWILLLLVGRQWKLGLTAVATAAVASLLPAILWGPQVYQRWLEASQVGLPTLAMPGNSSFLGLTSRFGSLSAGWILSALAVAAALLLVIRKRETLGLQGFHELGVTASLLASPVAWAGYTLLLLPIFMARRDWNLPLLLAAALLAIPVPFQQLLFTSSRFNFVAWGWLYGWSLAGCLIILLVEGFRRPGPLAVVPASS